MERRRATDQDIFKKVAIVLAVPVLTAVVTALVSWGVIVQTLDGFAEKNKEMSERMGKLEAQIHITHEKIVDYMIRHTEQDRREFNDLRKGR